MTRILLALLTAIPLAITGCEDAGGPVDEAADQAGNEAEDIAEAQAEARGEGPLDEELAGEIAEERAELAVDTGDNSEDPEALEGEPANTAAERFDENETLEEMAEGDE